MDFLTTLQLTANNPGAMCGATWRSGTTDNGVIASYNPANGDLVANVFACNENDYHKVIQQAQSAFKEWRMVPAPKRGEVIRQIANALRAVKHELGCLVSVEMGKSLQEGIGEVQEMIDVADFAVGQARMLYGKTMHSERPRHRMYEQWHPYGVVGIISAFNFPVAVWAWNAFLAAVCGNTCVWKPSEKTPLCAVAVHKICEKVLSDNDCPDIFSYFIPRDMLLAEKFIADNRLPLISFTGSTVTGRHVAQAVATRLGRTILELGGNNAIIIDETADLKLAIPATVFGAVGTAGQRCTTTRRVFIHESIYQDVIESLRHAYEQCKIGDPLDERNIMGPLIDAAAVTNYKNTLVELSSKGAEVVFGGKVIDRPGFYVEPTIVSQVQNDWDIVQHETFAPILYLMKFSHIDEAILAQNSVAQGLSSAIFTRDLQNAEKFLSAIGSDCGIANVNIGTSGAEIGGAFGGEKDTGGGRESGSDAWKGYMRRQTTTINWSDDLPLAQGIKFNFI